MTDHEPITEQDLAEIEGDYRYDDRRDNADLWAKRAWRLLCEVRRLRESIREVELLARSALRRLGDEPENDLDPADMVRGLDKWLTDWSHGGTHPHPASDAPIIGTPTTSWVKVATMEWR